MAQRRPGGAVRQAVACRTLDGNAPGQLLVLDVALAELEGDLRLHKLGAKIEGMRPIGSDLELGIEGEGITRDMVAVAVIDMNPIGGDFDTEICITYCLRRLGDLGRRRRKGLAVAQAGEAGIDADRQLPELLRRMHDAPRAIGFADRRPAMRALAYGEDVGNAEFGDDAEKDGVDAGRIRLRQFGEIADAHQDAGFRPTATQLRIARQRGGESERDGIKDRIEDERTPSPIQRVGGAAQRIEIARLGRDEHRQSAHLGKEVKHGLVEAEHEFRSGASGTPELVAIGGVDADREAGTVQRSDRVLEMVKGRSRQAAEIYDIGAFGSELAGAVKDRLDRKMRCLDNLRENPDIVATEVDTLALAPESRRKVVKVFRAALDRQAEFLRQ